MPRRLVPPLLLLALGAPLAAAGATGPAPVHCAARATPGCTPARLIASPTGLAASADGAVVVRSGVGSLGSLGVFALDRATGRLRQLPGRAGCVARHTRACMPGRGLETPSVVAFSPVGRSVYVAAQHGHTLAHYRRSPSGALVAAGCWGSGTGCRPVPGLRAPRDVELWADGSDLYVAASRVLAFSRAPDGSLSMKGSEPFAAYALALSGSGDSLYAAGPSRTGGTLVVYRRDLDSGLLEQVQRLDASTTPALRHPIDVVPSPDGRHVYVASAGSAGILVLRRDLSTGRLAFASCATAGGAPPCARLTGLEGIRALDRTGTRFHAAAAHRRGGLSVFRRAPSTGALTRLRLIRTARGMQGPNGVVHTADGRHVVVTSPRGVTVFRS
jgi:DNA-binding beta-propeller fold protein YncE